MPHDLLTAEGVGLYSNPPANLKDLLDLVEYPD
jgi:hypothetical protein